MIFKGLFLVLGMMLLGTCHHSETDKVDEKKECGPLLMSTMGDIIIKQKSEIPFFVTAFDGHPSEISFKAEIEGSSLGHPEIISPGLAVFKLRTRNINNESTITVDVQNVIYKACKTFSMISEKPEGRVVIFTPGKNHSPDILHYGSLSDAIKKGFIPQKGDLLLLETGNHGDISLTGNYFEVAAKQGSNPVMTSLTINDGHKIKISGIIVQKTAIDQKKYLVDIDSSSSDIAITNCLIQSVKDASEWTFDQWRSLTNKGIRTRGIHTSIKGCLVHNVFHGIKVESNHNLITYNIIDRFSGDAIRNTGSDNVFSYNTMSNATIDDYDDRQTGNHDDLFQSWTFDQSIKNIHLIHNIAISCGDKDLPLKSRVVQGLVNFDGFSEDWIVRENTVIVDHPHGIALFGARDCIIEENKIIRNPFRLFDFEAEPWIMVHDHKDGRISTGNILRQNVVPVLMPDSKDTQIDSNTVYGSGADSVFVNYQSWNFKTKKK